MFSERGFAGASIEHIARHAQLSVGAIYLYFRSKEDLYISLLENTFLLFDAELTQLAQHATAADQLPSMWAYLVSWAERDPEGTRILRLLAQPGVGAQLSADVSAAIKAGLDAVRRHLAGAITAGIEVGLFRATDATQVAGLSWTLLLGTMASLQTTHNLAGSADDLQTASQQAYRVLAAALAPASAAA